MDAPSFPLLTVLNSAAGQSMDYHCPGERQPVSRAIHLARLASGHRACRECRHQQETGSLPGAVIKRLRQRPTNPTFLMNVDEGIRGLYTNELTRERISYIVRCILDIVEEERESEQSDTTPINGPLRIVVGFDGRPESPDLAIGVVQALKQSLTDLIDVGLVTRPELDFSIDRFHPHLGLFVTGGLHSVGWTGLDLLDGQSWPWLTMERQLKLQQRLDSQSIPRRSRVAGRYQTVEISGEYEAALSHQFHALRPLRIGITCPDHKILGMVKKLTGQTPCDVRFLQTGSSRQSERSQKSLPDLICERHLDLGFAIAQDGRGCELFDETGAKLSVDAISELLLLPYNNLSDEKRTGGRDILHIFPDERTRRERQRSSEIPVIVDEAGRSFFLDESPACDAVQTFARLLEVLSLSERRLSYVVASLSEK
ncbi:MAG TPA: hypothetical protein VNQ76_10995 [Planctomicrobium sp.]|nr:hypothetical protein [Planctomicrobium sp.]